MKKSIALILAVFAVCVCFASCGDNADGYKIDVNGEKLECDADAAEYIEKLGDGYEYSEAISCAYDGLDKIYMYDGVSIYTYPQGDKDMVSEIELTSNKYSTDKGIKIGMSVDELKKAYGESFEEQGILLVYYKNAQDRDNSVSAYFAVDNGVITSIGITSPKAAN